VSDHLGTPTEMYEETGQLAWRMQLDAFGASKESVAPQQNPWRWPGQYADEETGLHYNRFRYYDPTLGEYISPDPIRLAGGLHLQGYVHDPTSWSDPMGLAPQCSRITPGSLPAEEEAALLRTLRHIDAGTTPTGPLQTKWGTKFKNWNGDLPGAQGPSSPYREYRVAPPPGTSGPGARRVVVNTSTGDVYYTWTHYGDSGPPAFVQIR